MANLDYLYREKSRFINLKTEVQKIVNEITISLETLTLASANIDNSYAIDDSKTDNMTLSKRVENLRVKNKALSSQIIPAIKAEINRIDYEIDAEITRLNEVS